MVRRAHTAAVMKEHDKLKEEGLCINGASHPRPGINPSTKKPYTRCAGCRYMHGKTRGERGARQKETQL